MAYLTYKHSSYYAVFSSNGSKKWIRIGNVSKSQARNLLKRLESEYTTDSFFKKRKNTTLYKFIDIYLEYSSINKAPKTVKEEIRTFKLLKSFTGDIELDGIQVN